MAAGKGRAAFWDPTGRHGIPTYPWQMAPAHLVTRRQLAEAGLRPGGQAVVAQVRWRTRRRGSRAGVAYLYDAHQALPKRTPTPAQLAALAKAMAARRACPACGRDAGHVLPRNAETCPHCTAAEGMSR